MKSILLIGLGRFGKHVAIKLNKLGHQVMAVDSSEERVSDVCPLSPMPSLVTAPTRHSSPLWGSETLMCAS